MKRDEDMDRFPVGTMVRTPSGLCGRVEKHRGAQSKQDHFQRVVVRVGDGPRDTIVLQPKLLQVLNKCPELEASE